MSDLDTLADSLRRGPPRRISYLVYAGWYGHLDAEWEAGSWTYGFWQWYGPDLAYALHSLRECQQAAFDFVGLEAVHGT